MILFDWNILKAEIEKLKNVGKKIVFTNGVFDIIHPGHIDYLNKSKALGDILVVALNSDDSVKRLKGSSRPIVPLNDRAIVVDALKSTDFVTSFEQDTPFEIITSLLPDILTKGGDYIIPNIVGAKEVLENGGKVEVIDFIEGKSSSSIINKLT